MVKGRSNIVRPEESKRQIFIGEHEAWLQGRRIVSSQNGVPFWLGCNEERAATRYSPVIDDRHDNQNQSEQDRNDRQEQYEACSSG